jgi:hypothetical protein
MSTTKEAAALAALLMSEQAARMFDPTLRDGAALAGAMMSPVAVADDALTLIRIGKSVSRWAVRACNGEGSSWVSYPNGGGRFAWTEADDAKRARADARALAKAQGIADQYGATVQIGGDPRGYVFRLMLASGRKNGWGDGWGVA